MPISTSEEGRRRTRALTVVTADSRLFISYARRDDEAFAARLVRELRAAGTTAWRDRDDMPSRGPSFRQELRDAIAGIDRVILVVGPAAAASAQVRAEWEQALETCKPVVPVLGIGEPELIPPPCPGRTGSMRARRGPRPTCSPRCSGSSWSRATRPVD